MNWFQMLKQGNKKQNMVGAVAVFCLHGKKGILYEPLSSFNIERGNGNQDILCKKIYFQ